MLNNVCGAHNVCENSKAQGRGKGENNHGAKRRAPLFLPKFFVMEVKRSNRGMYWLLFFISTAALIFAIATHWEWLTLIIPFVTTFFVLAMDII